MGSNRETITEDTAIFIPVLASVFFLFENYEGQIINKEQELRYVVNKDTNNSKEVWAVIKRKGDKKAIKLVRNIKQYRFESPLFKINVPKNSLLRNRMEVSVKPRIYDAITAGYFIMLKSLPPSTYRIMFGGKGVGFYSTNSVYDTEIIENTKEYVKDTSNSLINSKYFASF